MGYILFSNNCPKCGILKTKLKAKNIKYEEINDVELMISKGLSSMPILEVDGVIMDFSQANNWINKREEA